MSIRIDQVKMQVKGQLAGWRERFRRAALQKEDGIDGILVTVGLCIIALLLCVVMKDSLTDFIQTIVQAMTDKAKYILTGTTM